MPHFSGAELAKIERMRRKKNTAGAIHTSLVLARKKKQLAGPGMSTVYDYLAGNTFERDADETRGVESNFGKQELRVYDQVRMRMQKTSAASDHPWQVTWEDIATSGERELRKRKLLGRDEKGLAGDTLRKRMRAELGVQRRPAAKHAVRTVDEEGRRYRQALVWRKHRQSFWQKKVAFIDNKRFVCARTPAQRKRLRSAGVTHHLRKAKERSQDEYIAPKQDHQLCGIPSVEITAAVADDRIIFWRVVPKKWCGQEAANMYKELGKTLRLRLCQGPQGYRVVEDGDPKGYQSNKGKDAKAAADIVSLKLPPRSPEWMPLDYSLWAEIEKRMLAMTVNGTESKENWIKRLRQTALSLPRSYVKSTIAQMKDRIEATAASKGKHIKMDS
jgi:hypothetical protein